MKKKNRIILWIISALIGIPAVIMITYMIIMHEPSLQGWEAGKKGGPVRILIASSGSDFKRTMIQDVINQLHPEKRYFKVIDLSKLPKARPSKYRAIAILNSCEMWKMDSNVRNFLEQHSSLKKIVLLTTSGNSKWKSKKYNVDTISGASKKQYRSEMIRKLVKKLEKLLQ